MVNGDTAESPPVAWKGKGTSGAISIAVHRMDGAASDGIHAGSSIEWWFVHGSFAGQNVQLRHFMISIFRYDLTRDKNATDDGYYVILQVLDPATGTQSVVSRGERRIIDDLLCRQDEARSTNLDRDLVNTYIDEIRSYGPPAPVTLVQQRPVVVQDPFSFSWDDIRFTIYGDEISLSFGSTGDTGPCRFRFVPQSPRYHMENIGASPYRAMTYVTRPLLALSGTAGDEPVFGTAWFDHQWGNSGWFLEKPGEGHLHGWDWTGISGRDGSSWIFLIFHDPESGTVLARNAFAFGNRGEVRTYTDFAVTPSRFWTSPVTRIQYPVAMEITVPEADARLSVEPVADDQEIPILGFMRAVWEGAARCSGSVGGVPFSGTARLELQGYGYIFDFRKYIAYHTGRIRTSIDEFIPPESGAGEFGRFADMPGGIRETDALNETIIRPCRDLLTREKKYWRPVFALLLLESLGVRSEDYLQLLSVVPELTHTGTLIIDDIEDNAETRRGDLCIHRRYGTDVAINAANTLYFLPSILYSTHPDLTTQQRLEFYRVTLDSFIRGHFGQAQDIYWSKNLTEENLDLWTRQDLTGKILQMYEMKTATAAVAMAEAGCILAGSAPRVRDACVAFARALGTAFQIADDIQSFEPMQNIPETPCDDIAAGKVTYVIARALVLLDAVDRKELIRILCSPAERQRMDAQKGGVRLVRKSGALEVCRGEAVAMLDEAWHTFSKKVPPSEHKVMLRLFTRSLVQAGTMRY
ncbi:MAG: Short chain isoprenyl diphosphate synthase [Methanoregula sp. PtaU1.Bin006]|uniref:polyprenyl synthetase family protein n=1 Tax=Methanoregula sp. PtaU1.Bin006 TaxID=1811681 RepID=UPI0009D4FD72|nr:polyprenyl synthetase family protein [Methanoregula sp. PtaU1.Bin006]OPY35186.1 MAG: Short chain isoprenyl diphosphate synthase [Methanoregula sp. PtaU1.Bin006]